MRRPLVRRFIVAFTAAPAIEPRAQRLQFAPRSRQFLGQLEHRLVLLGYVTFEIRHFFLQALNALAQRAGELRTDVADGLPAAALSRDISGPSTF